MKFFAKKSSKKSSDDNDNTNDAADLSQHDPQLPQPSAESPSGSPSPTKASRSPSKRSILRPESPSSREAKPSPSRPSRSTFARQATDSASRKKKIDPDTHPLNLPPEQRKRLSALSAMSDRTSMDVDKEPVNGATPVSPPPQAPTPPLKQQPKPSPPAHSNSFTVPVTNGAEASTNGAPAEEKVPQPPPHRSQPVSPVQTPAEEAETYKNEGNKYFKLKDYGRAVEFYTKGMSQFSGFLAILGVLTW